MTRVYWVQPAALTSNFTKSRVMRSQAEQGDYMLVAEIDTLDGVGNPVTSFTDMTGDRQWFYLIRYYDPATYTEFNDFSLGFLPFTPREKRIVSYIAGWVPEMVKPDLTDFEVGYALRLALNKFNVHPPETNFTIDGFPSNYEQFLVAGTMIQIVLQKYAKIAIRDYSYSDAGYSVTIDRGAKLVQAKTDLNVEWESMVAMAKWNFQAQGVGLGTIPMPISLGGSMKNALGVLDMYTMMGR